jgi:DNA-binding beta-propeller fold protein YncE
MQAHEHAMIVRVRDDVGTRQQHLANVQYAIEVYRAGFLVTDGHHNRVLHVTLDGEVTEFATFGNIVPTGLAVSGHTVYMAEAGPVPHLPQNGKVVAIDPTSGTVTDVASGAPLLVDVEFGRGRQLYALAQGVFEGPADGFPASPNTGSLVQVNADRTFTVIVDELDRPTSLDFIGNTAYVVNLAGTIWKIEDVGTPPFGARK